MFARNDVLRHACSAAPQTWRRPAFRHSTVAILVLMTVLGAQADGPIRLTPSNCYAGPTLPQMFDMWQENSHWMGVAVNPSDDYENVYAEAFPDISGTGSPLRGSYVPGETNFLVKDCTGAMDAWCYVKARGDIPQTNQYVIEYDEGQGNISFGTPITHTYGGLYWDCGIIHVWDVPMVSGLDYRFHLSRTGPGDVRMALLQQGGPDDWRSRQDALWEKQAVDPGVYDPQAFTCTANGTYALVVFHNPQSWQTGDFTVTAELAGTGGGGQPDLVIDHIEPDTAIEGQNVTATIYVRNQGNAIAATSRTSLKIDTTVQCPEIVTSSIPAGGMVPVTCNLGSLTAGIHHLRACADTTDVVAELYENNNWRVEEITVAPAAGPEPDLVVYNLGPSSAPAGQSIWLEATIHNRGPAAAGTSYTEFRLDGGIVCDEVETPPLAAGGYIVVFCQVGPQSLGNHTLYAEADVTDAVTEVSETNNTRVGVMNVTGPDLIVASVTPTQVPGGVPFPVIVRVQNIGNNIALSSYTHVTVDGGLQCEIPTPPLQIGQTMDVVGVIDPLTYGSHPLLATADATDLLQEANENNNTFSMNLEALVPSIVTVRPDGTGDFPTIQAAIDAVPYGGTVRLTDGVFSGPGNRDLDFHGKELTVESEDPQHPEDYVIDCGGSAAIHHRGFVFESGEDNDCVVSGVTIRNAYATSGAGIWCNGTGPTIRNVILTDNEAFNTGGGIVCAAPFPRPPFARLENVTIAHCHASGSGGALSYSNGVALDKVLITHCSGRYGAVYGGFGATATLTCCDIWGNPAGNWTGAIASQYGVNGNISLDPRYCDEPGRDYGLHLDSPCRPETNPQCGLIGATDRTCGYSGGQTYRVRADGTGDFPTIQAAINASVHGDVILLEPGTFTGTGNRDLNFWGRLITVAGDGGDPADYVIDAEGSGSAQHRAFSFNMGEGPLAIIQGITMRGGYRTDGGAMAFSQGSTPTVENCTFIDNTAENLGGAVYCNESSPRFLSCVFETNNAWSRGGALAATSASSPEFSSCFFRLNTASTDGGALYVDDGGIECVGCTFNGNYAATHGGCVYASAVSSVTIESSTLVNGGALFGGGLSVVESSTALVEATIIAFGNQGNAVSCATGGSATMACCDVYGNAGGDWISCISGQLGMNGNLCVDPLFCDEPAGDYSLHSDSPCAPGNNPPCGLMGAHEVGCGMTVPITCLVRPNGSGDYPTIQAAIDDVADGSLIELADGLYQGEGNRDINFRGKEIIVRSQSGNPETVVINCGGSETEPHRAFSFRSGETRNSKLMGVTITGGYETYCPGILIIESSPEIANCIMIDNHGYNSGGLQASTDSYPMVRDCKFIGNTVTNAGGAMCVTTHSEIFIERCQFIGNSAYWAGGALYFNNEGRGQISYCTFDGNTSDHWGGALHCQGTGSVPFFWNCTFHGNGAPQGGCVYSRSGARPDLDSSILAFSTEGGASYCEAGSEAVPYCCDIYGNTGGDYVGCFAGYQGTNHNLSADPLFCNALGGDYTLAEGSPCADDPSCGRLGAWAVACTVPLQGVAEDPQVLAWSGKAVEFWGAAPNPCRGGTTVRFALPAPAEVRLTIFDLNGRVVRNLHSGARQQGVASLAWDGRDDHGRPLATGVYCMRLVAGDQALTRTVILYH